MLTVGAVGTWFADDATVHPGCDLRGVGVMSLAHEFPWKGTYEVACHWRCLLMNGGWAEVFEVGSISAEWAGGGRARVPKWTLTLPKRGGKTMYQPWGAMKNLMRSEGVVKNSLKKFFCVKPQTYYLCIMNQKTWGHTITLGWWTDPGEQLKNCIEILLKIIFVNLLLHVVIVNLKLYHFNKGV